MKIFINDWKYKLIALILAFMLWFIVQGQDNPKTNQKFIVPIEIRNLEAGKNVDLSIKQVTVLINDKKMVVDNLTEDNIKAYIDMTEILKLDKNPNTRTEDHKYEAKINVEVYSKYTLKVKYSANPLNATVTLSDFSSKSMFIDVDYENIPPVGYRFKITDMPVKSAMITGSAENVNKVAKLVAPVSKVELNGFEGSVVLEAFDANGNEISDVKIEPNMINCSILCEPQIVQKNLLVVPRFKNSIQGNLKIKSIQVFPSEILVSGMSETLYNRFTVSTDYIDLLPIKNSFEKEVEVYMDKDLIGNVNKVKVKVVLEQIK